MRLLNSLILLLLFVPCVLLAQGNGFFHEVTAGETIPSIAQRYGVSAAELASANRIPSGARLAAGSRIWIPRSAASASASGAGSARTPTSSAPPGTVRTPSPGTVPSTSVVRTPTSAPTAPSASRSTVRTPSPAGSGGAARTPTTSRPTTPPSAVSRSTTQPSAPPSQATNGDTYVVRAGDSLWRVASRNSMTVEELAAINGLSVGTQLQIGQVLRLRGSAVEEVPGGGIQRTPPRSSAPSSPPASSPETPRASAQGFIWPVEGRLLRRFTNRRDEKYTGIDIEVPRGTEVRAARDGRVVYASDSIPAYGRMVIISHAGDLATCYAHLDRMLVTEGQTVRRGQVIGRSGDTGRGSTPFLHFEIRRNGTAIDPEPFLP